MVRKRGVEPLWVAPLDPKSSASASSATFALCQNIKLSFCVKNFLYFL